MASRSQTKPEISPKIEGLDDMVATIYNTSLLVGEKSGTSVDVQVDVKKRDGTEGRGGEGMGGEGRGPGSFFLLGLVSSCVRISICLF